MTDQYHSLTVVLNKDYRDDDAEAIIAAIKMIRGVISVEGNVADVESHTAEYSALQELRDKMFSLLYPKARS